MNEAKYTKGPWYVEEDMIATDDLEIAFLGALGGYMTREMREANGRLIAAAPELLEALQWAKDQGWLRYSRHLPNQNAQFCDGVDKALAAIAKATGA